MRYFLFAATFLFLVSLTKGAPLKCSKVSSTYSCNGLCSYVGNVSGSATLEVYKRDGIQYVSISNVNMIIYQSGATPNQICYDVGKCTTDLSTPFEMQVGNQTLRVYAFFPGSDVGVRFFNGLVDDNGFFNFDGTFFSDTKNCYTDLINQDNWYEKEVHCCQHFEAVPQAPPNSPKCTNIQSRSTILNVDDNYSIFATAKMNFYSLTSTYIQGSGTFNGPSNCSVSYENDDQPMCSNNQNSSNIGCYSNGGIPMPSNNGKALIFVDFISWDGNRGMSYTGMLGRILIRDGQILMEEGIPFTPENNCYYQNYPYAGNSNQVVHNQFCCTSFTPSFHRMQQIEEKIYSPVLKSRVKTPGQIKRSNFIKTHLP